MRPKVVSAHAVARSEMLASTNSSTLSSNRSTLSGRSSANSSNRSNRSGRSTLSSNRSTLSGPVSGSEPDYEPGRWNNNKNIRFNHNCYAYVLNKIASNRRGKPQPGYFGNYPAIKPGDYNCETFYKRIKKDNPLMYKTDLATPCSRGFHKGFIALDTKASDQDYHFYRQDSNGLWSHKPGRGEATNLDASGKKIPDPSTADRKYKYYNYSKPCFFFCVNTELSSLHSR